MKNKVGNKRISYVMEKALFASFIGHLCFIPLFLWLGIREMVILNFFSTSILLFSVFLTRKRNFTPAYIMGITEIIVHAMAAVYFIGWNGGFHYYLMVLIPFIFFWPSWSNGTKAVSSLILFGLYSFLFFSSQIITPAYQLLTWQANLTTLVNILAAFTTFAAVAQYYQSSVNEAESNLMKANARLTSLAKTDPLTELQNRRTIFEKMGEVENRSNDGWKMFSIIIADIDHFKIFNDQYGHQFGDQVLVSIAKILRSATRSIDIVSRWGGEEFLILLPETNGEEAREVADRIRDVIDQTSLILDKKEIHFSMTFGVAECDLGAGLDNCLNLADKALYEGKKNGRNQVVLLKNIESIGPVS
jgi:diguanylate cyclase (GGDEF)-like protein